MRLIHWLSVSLAASMILLSACSGDNKEEDAAAPSDSAAATAAATSPAGAASSQVQAGHATDCFSSLKSYRYTGSYDVRLPGTSPTAFTLRGSAVTPDRIQIEIKTDGLTAEAIYIGDDLWLREGNGPWEKDVEGTLGPAPTPQDFCIYSAVELEKAGITGKKDKLNGVAALRYEATEADQEKLDALPASAAISDVAVLMGPLRMTLWVTEREKWPLRFTIVSERGATDAGSFKTELNITDFNKSDIRIEAPR